MGHANNTIKSQVIDILLSKLRIGESKHLHKIAHDDHKYIFSWCTYHGYLRHALYFAQWAKSVHKCRTVEESRQYADEWIQSRIDAGLSAYTIKLEVAALCKLYGDTAADYIPTPPRLRANITRSRGPAARDAKFSETLHSDFVEFCRSTGLRRHELSALHAGDLWEENGNYYVHVRKGKGGKERDALVVGNIQNVLDFFARAENNPNKKVFDHIPDADIHSYRSDYCTSIYLHVARDPRTIKDRREVYCCRKDRKNVWLDRRAMLICSHFL